jgi:hypothetical protein
MRRALAYGLLAMLGAALVHGVAWWMGLTFGLLAVAIGGGWLIGYAVRTGAPGSSTPPATASTAAALLGAVAFVLGSFVAFVIVQLTTGAGALADRLSVDKLGAFAGALFDPPLLQGAVLVAYVVMGWLKARPVPAPAERNSR